jgi:5,10-methylenetetrahydromethanopterin reductase
MSPGMLRLAGELADGALPLLFPPEHYYSVCPYIEEGVAMRDPSLGEIDLAACIWVSLDEDRAAARQALAQKVAYYGHALSPLILERLGLTQADFAPIERALMAERDEPKALALVDERMLAIGVVGDAQDVIARIEPLAQAGARHISFGPPLGPDPLAAVRLLGGEVLPHFGS